MQFILEDVPQIHRQLNPLTLNKSITDLRCGIETIKKKWELHLGQSIDILPVDYLSKKYPRKNPQETDITIFSHFLPSEALCTAINSLGQNQSLVSENQELIAYHGPKYQLENFTKIIFKDQPRKIAFSWDLFLQNAEQIKSDFLQITCNRTSEEITDKFVAVYNPSQVFVEKGAQIKACILNAENGPIYIGKDAVIQEGSIVIGPAAICEHSVVAWGSKIRMNTTIGPNCRVGGEVGSSIFLSNSNKAHDGYLGNSVIGSWCNLGANTNNSNLKNDLKPVKMYSYTEEALIDSGEIFCGTIMGDYSKTGISTMLNTGTTIGLSCNVFGSGFQDKYIPSFSWGGAAEGIAAYRFDKALQVIKDTLKRRNEELTADEEEIIKHVHQNT